MPPHSVELQVIPGGRAPQRIGALRVELCADDEALAVDAVAREEDRFLVLSAPPNLQTPAEHPMRVMTALIETEAQPLGAVLLRRGAPHELLAVVHDLEREPSCGLDAVELATRTLLRSAQREGFVRLELPLLGTRHGRLDPEAVAARMFKAMVEHEGEGELRLWVRVPEALAARLWERLRAVPAGC